MTPVTSSLAIFLATGCNGDEPPGSVPAVATTSDTGTPEPPRDTVPPTPGDTAWWRETGSIQDSGSAGCLPDPATCDVTCDGGADAQVVFLLQPDGAVLTFTGPDAAVAVADPGATVVVCPGVYEARVEIGVDLDLVAWDSGLGNRPVLRSDGPGVVITIAADRTARLVGLDVAGCVPALKGGSGSTGSTGSTGGSGAAPAPGGSGAGLACVSKGSTGIRAESGSTVEIRRSRVHAHDVGGIVGDGPASLTVLGTRVDHNAAEQGGGIALYGAGAGSLVGVAVEDNDAETGGGLYVDTCPTDLLLEDVTLAANAATGDGGGLYARECAVVASGSLAITTNTAVRGGGAYLRSSDLTGPLSIQWNTATSAGGGVHADGGALVGPGSIGGNSAAQGGGVYAFAPGDSVTLSADLESNGAGEGGALYVLDGVVTATGTVRTNAAVQGGGAVVAGPGTLAVDGADWGLGPFDNAPPDVYPVGLGEHAVFGLGACFDCSSTGCAACP